MEMYGYSTPDFFRVDDLLDFSNNDIFSEDHHHHHHNPNSSMDQNMTTSSSSSAAANIYFHSSTSAVDFTADLGVPNEDVAELEWLSNFVDDSYTDFPVNDFAGTLNSRSDAQFHGRSRSKRTKPASTNNSWTSPPESSSRIPMIGNYGNNGADMNHNSPISSTATSQSETRRCTHCASEKTPQWRTGPLGPKTLCNACGVRYKSGRLVPEYRPAASPTFVLTQHSNSHRKVMELRRQKEEQQMGRNFEVC